VFAAGRRVSGPRILVRHPPVASAEIIMGHAAEGKFN
jgi:hypothetical protein